MSKSKIEWTDVTWSPITGCTKISPGCQNCYAERMSKRLAGRCGYPKENPFAVTLHPDKLGEPLKWKKPRRVFVCSMGDLFHEDVPFWVIDDVIDICDRASQHTFLILTKRIERAYGYFDSTSNRVEAFEKAGCWLGITAENQAMADERWPILLQIPAAVRFVSVEPMLGPVDVGKYLGMVSGCQTHCPTTKNACRLHSWECSDAHDNRKGIDWVICGGESGPGARPAKIEWIRDLKNQCVTAGVPFFLKQMHIGGKMVKMPELDGEVWREMPDVSTR